MTCVLHGAEVEFLPLNIMWVSMMSELFLSAASSEICSANWSLRSPTCRHTPTIHTPTIHTQLSLKQLHILLYAELAFPQMLTYGLPDVQIQFKTTLFVLRVQFNDLSITKPAPSTDRMRLKVQVDLREDFVSDLWTRLVGIIFLELCYPGRSSGSHSCRKTWKKKTNILLYLQRAAHSAWPLGLDFTFLEHAVYNDGRFTTDDSN